MTDVRPHLVLDLRDRGGEEDVFPPDPIAGPEPLAQPRRRLGGMSLSDVLNLCGAAVSSACVTLLLFGRIAPFSGAFGFTVVAFITFLTTYAALVWLVEDGPAVPDRLMTALFWTAALVTFGTLVYVVTTTLWQGHDALTHLNFFTDDMAAAGPLDPVTVGGIKHALIGTMWMTSIALAITAPLGLAAAVYINEIGGRFARFVRTLVDAMTALPSVLAGLFIYATWILALGNEQSGFAAALAIAVVMLPIIIRSADVVLRLVPGNLREASAALGAEQWRTVRYVVLPTARSGLATSVILGLARGIGETAPVLLTAGFTAATNTDPRHGPMVSLPLFAFNAIFNSSKAMNQRGFAAASFLLIVVLVLFVIARVLGGRGPGQVSKRQRRAIERRSARDAERFQSRHTPGEVDT
jgi:phosphate transport system permease protein